MEVKLQNCKSLKPEINIWSRAFEQYAGKRALDRSPALALESSLSADIEGLTELIASLVMDYGTIVLLNAGIVQPTFSSLDKFDSIDQNKCNALAVAVDCWKRSIAPTHSMLENIHDLYVGKFSDISFEYINQHVNIATMVHQNLHPIFAHISMDLGLPDFTLKLIGSSATKLSISSASDFDFTICLPTAVYDSEDDPERRLELLDLMAKCLVLNEVSDIEVIRGARIPILTFKYKWMNESVSNLSYFFQLCNC